MNSGLIWRKSSYSVGQGNNCVEVATLPGTIMVRDSRNAESPALRFTPDAWRAFTARLKGCPPAMTPAPLAVSGVIAAQASQGVIRRAAQPDQRSRDIPSLPLPSPPEAPLRAAQPLPSRHTARARGTRRQAPPKPRCGHTAASGKQPAQRQQSGGTSDHVAKPHPPGQGSQ